MNAYVLSHALDGEQQRLTPMPELLDPLERAHLQRLGCGREWTSAITFVAIRRRESDGIRSIVITSVDRDLLLARSGTKADSWH